MIRKRVSINSSYNNLKGGFLTLIGMLVSLLIISFLVLTAFNVYFKKSSPDKTVDRILTNQDVNTLNYQSIVENSREKIDKVNKKLLDRASQLEIME